MLSLSLFVVVVVLYGLIAYSLYMRQWQEWYIRFNKNELRLAVSTFMKDVMGSK